ncbi:uncharacterized protein LOC143920492 [Arctopsyche grandis]|uniref:uncharacterized protein LOC143920492 n=1 Tax=Arctopsyche grandis TaxID=121162 RepID=UPI00406D99ED
MEDKLHFTVHTEKTTAKATGVVKDLARRGSTWQEFSEEVRRNAAAYCTVSEAAILAITATPPFEEQKAVYRREQKNYAKERTMYLWQTRWDASTKGRWPHRLIRDLRDMAASEPTYMHKIGKMATSGCHHCSAENDDSEHTAYDCPAWNSQRTILKNVLGINPLTTIDMVPAILESAEAWTACTRFAVCIMQEKEEAERV